MEIKSTSERGVIARKKPEVAAEDVVVNASSSAVDRSFGSVESSSLATTNYEQPQHRRRYSNLSNLAQSLPSTTLSSSLTCGDFSGAAVSTTTGGSLDHVSGAVKIKKSVSGGGSRTKRGSKQNSSDSGRVRPKFSAVEGASNVMDEGVQVVGGVEIRGGVRRTRSALETTRGNRAGAAAVELLTEGCNSPSEEITLKSPLLVQRVLPSDDSSQPREKIGDIASPTQPPSRSGRFFVR